MAMLLSQKTPLASLPAPRLSNRRSLSQLRLRRLAGGASSRLSTGVSRRLLPRSSQRPQHRLGGKEVMTSSSRASPPPWRSDNDSSGSVIGYDEEEGLLLVGRGLDNIEMSHSTNKSGNSASLNVLSVQEAPRGDFQENYSSTNVFKKNCSRTSAIKCFGVDLSPDNIAVAVVYFVQGVLGLARLAVSFYLKDDLHLDPAETAVISGFSSLPWLVKPLYGFISDSFPLFGYRRRSYLILSGLLGAFSWSLMATFVDSKYGAAACILLGSLSVAFSDVVVDSMVVERARGESQSTSGSLQSLCWGSSAFGGIVSAYFSGSLVDAYGVKFVFGVTAILPLMTSAVAVLVKEQAMDPVRGHDISTPDISLLESCKQSSSQLWNAVKLPDIFLPTLFIFLWQATPHSDSAMFYFTSPVDPLPFEKQRDGDANPAFAQETRIYHQMMHPFLTRKCTNKLGFTPEFLGRVKLVTSIASLVGVGIYNTFLKNVPLRKIFLGTTIVGSALGMTQVLLVTGLNRELGISDEWFAIGDSLIITVLSQASFMPVLVLAAKLCPPGMEATLFATLMSISNGGSVAGGLMGAGLTQVLGITRESFGNLALLITICNLSSLLPLPLLNLLPAEIPENKASDMEQRQTKLS